MASAKKPGRPRKTSTRKKKVEEFPVDEVVADMKGVLLTENENTKKKDELKALKEEERKASFDNVEETIESETKEEIIEEHIIPEIEEITETVKDEQITEEVIEPIKEEPIVEENKTVVESKPVKMDKIRPKLTSYRQLGQIIDF